MKYENNPRKHFSRRVLAIFISCLLLLTTFAPLVFAEDYPPLNHDDVSTITKGMLSSTPITPESPEPTEISKDGKVDTVGSKDKIFLLYYFNMDEIQVEDMVSNTTSGTVEYPVNITLPKGLIWTGDNLRLPIEADTEDGKKYFGYLVVVSKDGDGNPLGSAGRAYLEFTGAFFSGDYATLEDAYVELGCALDMDEIKDAEEYEIELMNGKTVKIKVGDNQLTEHGVAKTGAYDAAANRFNWTITYTPGTSPRVTPFTLTDTFKSGTHVFVEGSFKLDGVALSQGTDYIVTDDGTDTTIQYTISGPLVQGTDMVFTYQTAVADSALKANAGETDITATNNASIMDKGNVLVGKADAGATATAENTKWMSKNGVVNGRNIDWTVTINTNDRRLTDLVMHDLLSEGLTLLDSTVKINGDSISPTIVGSATETFKIVIPKVSDAYLQTYTITYSTVVADSYFDTAAGVPAFDNHAWLTYDWLEYRGPGMYEDDYVLPAINKPVGVDTHIVKKTGVYDRATHEITWTVEVNTHKIFLSSGTITDDLSLLPADKGLTYVDGSFTPGDSTRLSRNLSSTNKKLIVDVGALGRDTLTYTFKTTVDNKAHFANNTPSGTSYVNDISFAGKYKVGGSGDDMDVTDSATGTVSVISRVLLKAGADYDINTNIVTWRVTLNQNKMPMTEVKLVDVIGVNQSFVLDSVTVKIGSAAVDTNPSGVGYDTGTKTLTVDLGTIGDEIIVTFKTLLDVDNIGDFKTSKEFTVSNSAKLQRNGYDDVTSSGNQAITNNMLNKTGETIDNNNMIAYQVEINPNGIDLTGLTLVDGIPTGLALDIDSVKLYIASVTAAGVFSKESEVDASNFSMAYDPVSNQFSLALPNGANRYVLEYECCVTDRSSSPFNNNISFDGTTITGAAGADSNAVALGGGGGGGGGASAKKARLDIVKQDSERPGVKLEGVEFKLYTEKSGTDILVAVGETDAEGKLSFYTLTPNRTYWLVESSGKEGYSSPKVLLEELEDYEIKPTAAGAMEELIVTNDPEKLDEISFFVAGEVAGGGNTPLNGVEFKITDQTTGSVYMQTAMSAPDGKVVFENIPFGVYTVEQTQQVSGYLVNSLKYTLTIPLRGTGIAPSIDGLTDGKALNLIDDTQPATTSLTITNEVRGTTPDPGDVFEFTVELRDPNGDLLTEDYTYSGTGGSDTIRNGSGMISLEHGQEIVIVRLPIGTTYKVVAQPNSNGYTTTPAEDSGTLTANGAVAPFVNTRGDVQPTTSTLTITNEATDNGSSSTDIFIFTVTLKDPSDVLLSGAYQYSGTGGTGTITGGSGEITIMDGQSVVIEGLPIGTKYTVEQDRTDYEKMATNDIGTIPAAGARADFINTRGETQSVTSTLTITNVATDNGAPSTDDFTFTVSLTDPDGKPMTGVAYTGTGVPDGTISDGDTITLKNGQGIAIAGLLIGTEYTVVEEEANERGYTTNFKTLSGTIPVAGARADFINTRGGTQPTSTTLKITNVAKDKGSSSTDNFTFTVTLAGPDGKPLNGTYQYSGLGGMADGTISIVNGKGTIVLKDGQGILIKDLPIGAAYSVVEEEANQRDYTTNYKTLSGTIPATGATADFINTRDVSSTTLKITNVAKDKGNSSTDSFTYTITLTGPDGEPLNGTYQYSGLGSMTDGTISIVNGKGTITLKDGQGIIIEGLPIGTAYSVVEEEANQRNYTTNYKTLSGTIPAEGATADFINTRTADSTTSQNQDDNNGGNGTGNNNGGNGTGNNNNQGNSGKGPETGTPFSTLLYFVIATILLGGVAMVTVKKRKENR